MKTNNNKRKKDALKKQESCKNNKICFVIDTKPDRKNLDCLKMDLEPPNKKRKLHHTNNKAMVHSPSKDFKQSQKTKQHTKQSHKKEKKKKKCSVVHIVSSSATNLLWNPASSSTSNPTSTLSPTSTSDSNPNSNKLREIIVDGSNVARAYDSIFLYYACVINDEFS